MKIILAPDSFKGSLSARDAAAAMAAGVRRVRPEVEVVLLPLADGGEGTAEVLLTATQGRWERRRVTGPLGETVDAAFGLLGTNGETAVVEMAAAAGLSLVPREARDPRHTTTYGVGELLLAAAGTGASRIIVGLGGSATNDGGAGAMQALGVCFLDKSGQPITDEMCGASLSQVASIDMSDLRFPVGKIPLLIASDVTNPLTGPNGATAVYGPQKGADAAAVAELEAALTYYAGILKRDLGVDIAQQPGAGAAGGLGAGFMAFLGATVQSGIGLVLDTISFDAQARDADWVFTGEGRIDSQTAQGKAVSGVLARCVQLGNIPVIAFGGSVDEEAAENLITMGLRAAFPIVNRPMTLAEAKSEAAPLLEDAAARVMRLIAA